MAWLTIVLELPPSNLTTTSAEELRLESLRGAGWNRVLARVQVVTWFGEGYNPVGDLAGALVLHMVGQVRDQRLTAYQL